MEEEGVLLYYKFVAIPDTHSLSRWFRSLCSSLALVGRIRVAPDGVNVTVGGAITSLHEHVNSVKSHPWLGECDFKLAAAHSTTICKSAIAPEVGFNSLSVRIVKELVTLGVHPSKYPSVSDAGAHLSAWEFHSKIQEAGHIHKSLIEGTNRNEQLISNASNRQQDCKDACQPKVGEDKELVLLDVRNIYETRIGRFMPPEGVGILDPQIRQYSDLPCWIDSNAEKLQNKNILMYCTGGVRCEMASAYVKNKGKGFQNVFQLSGGIQRYLEAFPDGGFFKGKNFVFDHRVAVPSTCTEVLGMCSKCGVSFDDYSSRTRCSHCRMLLLICNSCQANISSSGQHQSHVCELCEASKAINNHHNDNLMSNITNELCSGEEAAQEGGPSVSSLNEEYGASQALYGPAVRRRLRILCLHGFRQSASGLKGRLASFTKKLKGLADFVFVDAPHKVPLIFSKSRVLEAAILERKSAQFKPEFEVPHRKYAWLVTPEMMSACSGSQASPAALISDAVPTSRTAIEFDKDQYKRQTLGWPTSLSMLEKVFSEMGPFDGVLGFSQGAAVAASLCLLSQLIPQANNSIKFRFVILCSGFVSPACELQDLMCTSLPLNCPSLHIFSESTGHDHQIVNEESMQLTSMFNSENSVVLTHNLGHIVPSHRENVDNVKSFLNQFI